MSLTAVLVISALIGLPVADAAGKGNPVAVRPILVEWRRDVWQPPDIRTLDESAGSRLTVQTGLRRGGRPRWSPDGLRIGGYLKPTEAGQWDVAIMHTRADGTDERVALTALDFDAFNVARGHKSALEKGYGLPFGLAAWSPDGKALVFSGLVRYEGDPSSEPLVAERNDRYQYRLFIVRLDGNSPRLTALLDSDANHDDFDPHWSTALNRIVFVRSDTQPFPPYCCEGRPERAGQQQLWAVNPDGTGLQQITNFGKSLPSGSAKALAEPVWEHAGTRIAVTGAVGYNGESGSGDIWVVDAAGTLPVTTANVIRSGAASEWHAAWSPTDDRVIYMQWSAANSGVSRFQIRIVNVGSGELTTIVDQTKQAVLHPDWNPIVPAPVP